MSLKIVENYMLHILSWILSILEPCVKKCSFLWSFKAMTLSWWGPSIRFTVIFLIRTQWLTAVRLDLVLYLFNVPSFGYDMNMAKRIFDGPNRSLHLKSKNKILLIRLELNEKVQLSIETFLNPSVTLMYKHFLS